MTKDLRTFLSDLEKSGRLIKISKPVDHANELSELSFQANRLQGKAILFENIKGYQQWRAVGSLFSNRMNISIALGLDNNVSAGVIANKVQEKGLTKCKLVSTGPVKQVIMRGKDASLGKLPISVVNDIDAGPFVASGMFVCRDPDTGNQNVAMHRHHVKSENKMGVGLAPRHTWMILKKYEKLKKPMPAAIVIGHHGAVYLGATWTGSFGIDEFEVASTLLGEPIERVKCETNDLEVPAHAEIIIEGEVPPFIREPEGPFGEHTGCTSGAAVNPVFNVKAITTRNDPIYYSMTVEPPSDEQILDAIPIEVGLYNRLKDIGSYVELKNVVVLECSGGAHVVVVQMIPRFEGEAKQVLMAALAGEYIHPKIAIAVDDDVNPYDPGDVFWAISTKVNPEKDVFIVPGVRGSVLDISLPRAGMQRIGGKMGIDATKPPTERQEDRQSMRRFFSKGHGKVHLKDFLS